MNTQYQDIIDTALALPEADRADIAATLIRSLETETDADADAMWAAEIQRRLDAIDRGEVRLVPWDDVMRKSATAVMSSYLLDTHPDARVDAIEAYDWYAEAVRWQPTPFKPTGAARRSHLPISAYMGQLLIRNSPLPAESAFPILLSIEW